MRFPPNGVAPNVTVPNTGNLVRFWSTPTDSQTVRLKGFQTKQAKRRKRRSRERKAK